MKRSKELEKEFQKEDQKPPKTPPKTQWGWLIILIVGGGLAMYLLAKLTRMLMIWSGLVG
ncbi:MAG TPA: hypothetical protein H9889_07800 [Candidatus Ignatzschineria merdigallinarum]|uniref:DUF2474 domain-containing protein n=1 Tax=Candidatus Ignatzschineria merdigallinarum TaxID=2838621 RepID=A0A9D1Q6W3_9GAMM|nr:hypothetical protein [Candidatus Ignatzschineria merdigallinarum]